MSENHNDILDKFENKLELHVRHRQDIEPQPSHVNIDTALGTCIRKDDFVILYFVWFYIVYSIIIIVLSSLGMRLRRTGC